jgi:hypothetical protein
MQSWGAGGGPGPRSRGANAYMIIDRADEPYDGDLQFSNEVVLADYVAERERAR